MDARGWVEVTTGAGGRAEGLGRGVASTSEVAKIELVSSPARSAGLSTRAWTDQLMFDCAPQCLCRCVWVLRRRGRESRAPANSEAVEPFQLELARSSSENQKVDALTALAPVDGWSSCTTPNLSSSSLFDACWTFSSDDDVRSPSNDARPAVSPAENSAAGGTLFPA